VGLDTPYAFIASVRSMFSSLHARALGHATEDLDRVKTAMANVMGDVDLRVSRTEGHHGNPIVILEATIEDSRAIDGFFARISDEDMEALIGSLEKRVDDGCNLFLKLDKQDAFAGTIRLGTGDDVISVRVKARVFPARREIAKEALGEYLRAALEARRSGDEVAGSAP
jgi:RNA binding exosome subunit